MKQKAKEILKKFLCPRRNTLSRASSRSSDTSLLMELDEQIQKMPIDPIVQWRSSPRKLQNLQVLLSKSPALQPLSSQIQKLKPTISDRTAFINLLKCYRGWLQSKAHSQQQQSDSRLLQKEYFKTSKQLTFCQLLEGIFSYTELTRLLKMTPKMLLEYIVSRPLGAKQRRAMLLQIIELIADAIPQYLLERLEFDLDANQAIFPVFMFTQEEEKAMRAKGAGVDSKEIMMEVVRVLHQEYMNYDLPVKILDLLESTYKENNKTYKQIKFILKMCSYFAYSSGRMDMSYKKVNSLSQIQLIHQLVSCETPRNLEQFRSIFELKGPGYLDHCYQQYVFSELCDMGVTLQLISQHRVSLNEKTLPKLVQKIRKGHYDYCRYSGMLENMLADYKKQEDVRITLKALEFARIFHFFEIQGELRIVGTLLREHKPQELQYLQQHSLQLLRQILTQYCQDRYKQKHPRIGDILYDFDTPEGILSLCLHLKSQLFGRLISQHLVHQMLLQHLIFFKRFRQLEQLLQPKNLDNHNINYELVEIVVTERIAQLFEEGRKWEEIRSTIEYLLGTLKSKTPERRAMKSAFKLAQYLHGQRCLPGGCKIPRQPGIDYLHNLLNANPQLDFCRLYKYILKMRSSSLEKVNIWTREFIKFRAEQATRLYRKCYYQQGFEILQKLSQHKPSWLTSTILAIVAEDKQPSQKVLEPLLMLAYENCVYSYQFEQLLTIFKTKLPKTQDNFFRRYIDTPKTYIVTDGDFVYKEDEYTNVVASSKFTDGTLKQQKYQLFFTLLSNDHERAFYQAYRSQLDLTKLQFFIKESLKVELFNLYTLTANMFKATFYQFRLKIENIQTTFKQFKQPMTNLTKINEDLKRYLGSPAVSDEYKVLLKKYLQNIKITQSITSKQLQHNLPSHSHLFKFFEDASYRKQQILQFLTTVPTNEIVVLAPLAAIENIDYVSECVTTLINQINNDHVPRNSQVMIANLSKLVAQKIQDAKSVVIKFSEGVRSVRNLWVFLNYLKDAVPGSIFNQIILKENLSILESLSKIQQQAEFHGLIPGDFIMKPIIPQTSRLSKEHSTILNQCLRLENVFIVSKVLYFVYGLNQKVEQQVFELAKSKSQLIADRLRQLQSPQR